MDLSEIRNKIDELDTTLFQTISERYKWVKKVVLWKEKNGKKIYDPIREEKIICAQRNKADSYNISADTVEDILRSLFAESHMQEKEFLTEDKTSPHQIRRKIIENPPCLFDLFTKVSHQEKNFFFLESLGDDEWNHSSFLGFSPKHIFAIKNNEVFIDGISQGMNETPFQWLEDQFKPYQNLVANTREKGFVGGLVGHINFEAIRYLEPSLQSLQSHPDFYDAEFGLFLDGLIYNRKTEELEYVFTEEDRFEKVLEILEKEITERKKNITRNKL